MSNGATDTLLEDFGPYLRDDDGSLVAFLAGLASGFEVVDLIVRDTDDGYDGWSILLDADRAPAWALRWLAQLVGVRLPRGTDEATARAAIRTPAGWKRGTVGAIRDAVRPLLTGAQTVIILERTGGAWPAADNPYHFTVATYTTETPDAAAVAAAVQAQKPAGLLVNVAVVEPHTWLTLQAHHATWADVRTAFATWTATEAGA